MKIAPVPQNEDQRLLALKSYKILDTEPEGCFDDLTFLASFVCQTPIALISLVDHDRQWIKSRLGIDIQEVKREVSFCAHALQSNKVFMVEDASVHPDFLDHPFVLASPRIRFYAGVPLVDRNGYILGTLCVIDHVPRYLMSSQLMALEALARHVMNLFELKKPRIPPS